MVIEILSEKRSVEEKYSVMCVNIHTDMDVTER